MVKRRTRNVKMIQLPPSFAKTLSTAPEHPPQVISTLYSYTLSEEIQNN